MAVIDVYRQYFSAQCVCNGVERKGVLASLTATSEGGEIRYEVTLTFFPHREPEDFAVSYDACVTKTIYQAKGRRSKKREAVYLEEFRTHADALALEIGGIVDWDQPLREAQLG